MGHSLRAPSMVEYPASRELREQSPTTQCTAGFGGTFHAGISRRVSLILATCFGQGDDRMADYYSVLARAVVNLETGDGGAREELYERARSIIVAELRKQNPKISALTITHEQAALEAAIRRLEAELQPRPRDKDRKSSPHVDWKPRRPITWERCRKRSPRCCLGPPIWRRSSASAASSICAVWRWSTPTSFNIRSCLAPWRVSDVC